MTCLDMIRLAGIGLAAALFGCADTPSVKVTAKTSSYEAVDARSGERLFLIGGATENGKFRFSLIRESELEMAARERDYKVSLLDIESLFSASQSGKTITWFLVPGTPEFPSHVIKRVVSAGRRLGIRVVPVHSVL